MKVAILSMQEVKNYGSFLQAFSLKKTIESLGHTCDFINIVPGRQLTGYKISRFHKAKLLCQRLWGWDFVKRFETIYKFQTRFSKEFLPYLGVGQGANHSHYDIVVIGSDEVFNCAQQTWFGFSPQLFGQGLNADKVITYAASFGATTLDKLRTLGVKDEVAGLLKQLACISVRDGNSAEIVNTLTGKEPLRHIDPVLIYDYTRYMSSEIKESDYMIVYTYPGRITNKNEIKTIRAYAQQKGLKLVSIGHYFPWCDEVVVPTPFEVLSCFRDAACVVTDTFHGSVFAIKYNKPFCTIIRNMNSQKLSCLLKQFGLEDRIVNDVSRMQTILDTPIDYLPVDRQLEMEREKAIQYLTAELASLTYLPQQYHEYQFVK